MVGSVNTQLEQEIRAYRLADRLADLDGEFARFSREPPYSSVRVFINGERNWVKINPCPPRTRIPSKPAFCI